MYKHVAIVSQKPWTSALTEVALAGGITGAGVQLLTFPLDPILTRMQVHGSGFSAAVGHVRQTGGWFGGLKGPLVAASVRRSVTFFPMEGGKLLSVACGIDVFWGGVAGSAMGGFAESCVTTVSERYKTIKQANKHYALPAMYPVTRETLRYWYRGMFPNAVKNVTANPILFALSPRIAAHLPGWIPDSVKPFASAFALSHVVQLWGAPLERCRALMQTPSEALSRPEYGGLGVTDTLHTIYKHEGLAGILKGYWLRSTRVGLVSGVTMTVYPKVLNHVGTWLGEQG